MFREGSRSGDHLCCLVRCVNNLLSDNHELLICPPKSPTHAKFSTETPCLDAASGPNGKIYPINRIMPCAHRFFRLLHLLKPRTRDNNSHPRTHVSLSRTPNALPLTPREIWKEEGQGGEKVRRCCRGMEMMLEPCLIELLNQAHNAVEMREDLALQETRQR